MPQIRAFPARTGATFHLGSEGVAYDPDGARSLIESMEEERSDPRVFRPFVIEDLVDPNFDGRREEQMRDAIEHWVRTELAPSLIKPTEARTRTSLVLEAVFPTQRDAFTITLSGAEARVERRFDHDYDALVSIAGSMLCDVIEGKRHWGDPLLAGLLRSSTRMYQVDSKGVRPQRFASIFLYYALDYEQSVERALEYALSMESH